MAWKATLADLRSAAIAQTVENPEASPAVRELAREGLRGTLDKWMTKVRSAARSGVSSGLAPPPSCTVYGWHVLLSRYRYPDGHYAWHLSARLHPPGRSSVERDWQMLGKIAAQLGAPQEPIIVPENPNDAHHWRWEEPPAQAPIASS